MRAMAWVLSAIVGYVLGSVPVALIVARRHGVDLYRTSDGNPGAWNALEQLGARRARPAFVGDAAEGARAGGGARSRGGRGGRGAGAPGARRRAAPGRRERLGGLRRRRGGDARPRLPALRPAARRQV